MKKTSVIIALAVCTILVQQASATPYRTPDAGTSSALLTGSIIGLAFLRKFFRR